MIVIDTNALVLLIVGLIDPKKIPKHKCLSIYEEQDFLDLVCLIGDFNRLIMLPNIWTEVDNLLNGFTGEDKNFYVQVFQRMIKQSTESYIPSVIGTEHYSFIDIGLTDSLLLRVSLQNDFLITSDSRLADYAKAHGIQVYDIVESRNVRLNPGNL